VAAGGGFECPDSEEPGGLVGNRTNPAGSATPGPERVLKGTCGEKLASDLEGLRRKIEKNKKNLHASEIKMEELRSTIPEAMRIQEKSRRRQN